MSSMLSQKVADQVSSASTLYFRLILLVGPPRTGKTNTLKQLAEEKSWPLVNVNLALSERLLQMTSRQRALNIEKVLSDISNQNEEDIVLFDNIEVLFSPELQQDPLRLLQSLARNRTIIAAWPGEFYNDTLTYAEPSHREFKRYFTPDAIVVHSAGMHNKV